MRRSVARVASHDGPQLIRELLVPHHRAGHEASHVDEVIAQRRDVDGAPVGLRIGLQQGDDFREGCERTLPRSVGADAAGGARSGFMCIEC